MASDHQDPSLEIHFNHARYVDESLAKLPELRVLWHAAVAERPPYPVMTAQEMYNNERVVKLVSILAITRLETD